MFLVSSPKPIDPELMGLVTQIENKSPAGVSVLAARRFRYGLEQIKVEVTISEPRKFNILEEFILYAGIELYPSTNERELATALGLDPVFVQNTTQTLRSLETLTYTETSQITLTPQGRQFYEEGAVPQPPKKTEIYAVTDPLQGSLFFISSPLQEQEINLPDLEDFIKLENRCQEVSELVLQELQRLVEVSDLGLHIPEDGKIITDAHIIGDIQKIWQPISIFVIFDVLEDQVRLQVRQGTRILNYASELLDIIQLEGLISLKDLFYLTDETIAAEREILLNKRNQQVEARIAKIQEIARENTRILRENVDKNKVTQNDQINGVILLRDSQIRQAFLNTIKSAKKQVFIYSPWVSKEVVDQQFLEMLQNLAKQGIWILIGHGIARNPKDEDRPISPEVEQKLREIKTPEGLSAVQIFWLGNSHAKEVLVDGKIHLCGSHNWLSYRGDRLPRGETVYQVTIPEQVQEAYKFLANRFESHAQKLWNQSIQNKDVILAESSLCIWGGLGKFEMALNQLYKQKFWSIYPLWLKVIRQALRAKNISPDADYLLFAVSMLSEISTTDLNIELLRDGWRKVISALASQNRNSALKLLSDDLWKHFIRLGIVQPPINLPTQFIDKLMVKRKKTARKKPED